MLVSALHCKINPALSKAMLGLIQLQRRRFLLSYNAGTKDFIALCLSPGTLLVPYPLTWATGDNSTRRKFHRLWNGRGVSRHWQSPEVIPEQFQSNCFLFLLQESFFSLRSKTFSLKEVLFSLDCVKTFCSDFHRAEEINMYFRWSPKDTPRRIGPKGVIMKLFSFIFLAPAGQFVGQLLLNLEYLRPSTPGRWKSNPC